jgi:hypothetical protein
MSKLDGQKLRDTLEGYCHNSQTNPKAGDFMPIPERTYVN